MYYQKWSTQAYQKAYQIRPSPLRRNGRCRLQAQSVLQPCLTGEVRGQRSKAAKPGAEQPEPRTDLQGEHGEDCEHPPFDTALGQRPQLNKPTSGRQARPPKGGSGHFLGQSFYVHKNTSGYFRFAGPDRTRCMATYKCALRENGRTLFALVVSLKMGSAQPGQPGRVVVVANRCCGIPSQTERGRR